MLSKRMNEVQPAKAEEKQHEDDLLKDIAKARVEQEESHHQHRPPLIPPLRPGKFSSLSDISRLSNAFQDVTRYGVPPPPDDRSGLHRHELESLVEQAMLRNNGGKAGDREAIEEAIHKKEIEKESLEKQKSAIEEHERMERERIESEKRAKEHQEAMNRQAKETEINKAIREKEDEKKALEEQVVRRRHDSLHIMPL